MSPINGLQTGRVGQGAALACVVPPRETSHKECPHAAKPAREGLSDRHGRRAAKKASHIHALIRAPVTKQIVHMRQHIYEPNCTVTTLLIYRIDNDKRSARRCTATDHSCSSCSPSPLNIAASPSAASSLAGTKTSKAVLSPFLSCSSRPCTPMSPRPARQPFSRANAAGDRSSRMSRSASLSNKH